MLKRVISALLVLLMSSGFCLADARSNLRSRWQEIAGLRTNGSPYLDQPDPASFVPGSLTEEAQRDALNCINFIRGLAGLEEVVISPLYTLRAQNGAMLLAANDQLEHDAPQPAGMNDDLYESAHMGTSLGNIVKFNWMKPDILVDGAVYFARDDGDSNLSVLGHRRWLLNPCMAETGFGLANSSSGMSYVTMYAVDAGNPAFEWDYVAWPSAGAFPVEMMRSNLPWSVSLNGEIYNTDASRIKVYLKEENSGAEFFFEPGKDNESGFCTLSTERCGSGNCLIFRPEIENAGIGEYVQNQKWSVVVTGLAGTDGTPKEIRYSCDMVSLYPQDVAAVELSQLEAELKNGETLKLRADVIPAYADDLSLIWGSSDPGVASVNAAGEVSAIAPGICTVTAMSANGRKDVCTVTVSE